MAAILFGLHNEGLRNRAIDDVCLIVPCYNESRRLNSGQFRDFLAMHPNSRILFVDDGSQDATRQVLEEVCRGYQDRAVILGNEQNQGKAEAVRTGINHALEHFDHRFAGYWDADLATPLDTVPRFLSVFNANPKLEMIFGARVKLLGRHVKRNELRHYLGRAFATVVSAMLRLPVYDTQCGAKLFRVNDRLKTVFAEPFLSTWVFDVEIIARYRNLYRRASLRIDDAIYEYPLETWIDIEGSKVRPKDFFRAFVDILRIKRKYL